MYILRKRGLTFLQVLLVIIILGILSSIAFIAVERNTKKAELSSKTIQADLLNEVVSKYTIDNGEVPTIIPNADYLEKPALIDVSKVALSDSSKFIGNYYIYGVKNKIYYDYPTEYIGKIRDKYVKDKNNSSITGLINGTNIIDVKTLYTEKYLDYPALTQYLLNTDGSVIQIYNQDLNGTLSSSSGSSVGIDKPTTPIIIPNRTAPYFSNQEIIFTAKSNYTKGTVTYTWSGGYKSNGVYGVGTYSIEVIAVGSDGTKSDKATFQLVVSKANSEPTKPTITYTPNLNIDSNTFVTFTANSTDPDGDAITYKWIGSNIGNLIGNPISKKFNRGDNSITVYAVDQNGNYSEKTTVNFTVKNSAPIITGVTQSPNPANQDDKVDLVPIIEDADGDMFTFEIKGLSETKKYTIGTHPITIIAKDSLGATSSQFTYNLEIVNRPPSKPVLSMSPNSSSDIRSNTAITFTASGSSDPDGDTITYEYDNKLTYYSVGLNTVKVRAIDSRGLTSDWATLTFTVNNTAPTIPTITMTPSYGLKANSVITWSVSGSTDIDGDTVTYEWVNKQSTYAKGTYTIQARAKDSRGAYSSYATKTFTVENSAPVITSFTFNNEFSPNATLNYVTAVNDIDINDTFTYEYAITSNSTTPTTFSVSTNKAPTEAGTYYAWVRVYDSEGAYSNIVYKTFKVINEAPSRPIITVSPTGKKYSNTPLYISASGSIDPEGSSITYVWRKGQAMNGGTLAPGIYEFEVYAKDQYGAESPAAAAVVQILDQNGSGAGGLLLTDANSRIYYPTDSNLPTGATFTKYSFNVPSVSGHSGSDYAYVKGLNKNTGNWDQLIYQTTSNGISFPETSVTPNTYIRLEYFYYASHCMYGKSNITYTMEYEYN